MILCSGIPQLSPETSSYWTELELGSCISVSQGIGPIGKHLTTLVGAKPLGQCMKWDYDNQT